MSEAVVVGRIEPGEQAAVLALLAQHHLPVDGLADHWDTTLVVRTGGKVVGSAALEVYGEGGLLRSVAVDDAKRGRGFGQVATRAALGLADAMGLPAVYLLTTTADGFFPKFGFATISRADVPASVQQSVEFTSACPASAIVMRKPLALS